MVVFWVVSFPNFLTQRLADLVFDDESGAAIGGKGVNNEVAKHGCDYMSECSDSVLNGRKVFSRVPQPQ